MKKQPGLLRHYLPVLLFLSCSAIGVQAQVVISQIYGGGGNAGATFRNDFIELFNRTNTPVSLAGWSVQYATNTGATWTPTSLTGTIPSGGYYLIQMDAGTGGTVNLPTPDVVNNTPLNALNGKVALVNVTAALSGSCPTGTQIIDLVGYGSTASCFEGSGPTSAPSNTSAVLRASNGCQDTGQNATDFAVGVPNPRNSATPVNLCTPPSVTATLATAPLAVCAGAPVTFTANVGEFGVSYSYTLSNGTNSASATGQTSVSFVTSVATTVSGAYTLTVSSVSGSSMAVVGPAITLNPTPTVTLTFPGGTLIDPSSVPTIRLPTPGQVQVSVSGGTMYEWVQVIDRINGYELRQTESNTSGLFTISKTGPYRITVNPGSFCSRTVEGLIVN